MSVVLNGSNQFLSQSQAILTAAPCTIMAWGKPSNTTANGVLAAVDIKIVSGYKIVGVIEAGGNTTGDPARAYTYNGTSFGIAVTSTSFASGSWQLFSGVFTSATARAAFLDGGGKGTNATNLVGDANEFAVGVRRADGTPIGHFPGRISHVAIWNIPLSDANMVTLAGGADPRTIEYANLIAYWPLATNGTPLIGSIVLAGSTTPPTWDGADQPVLTGYNPYVELESSGGLVSGGSSVLTVPSLNPLVRPVELYTIALGATTYRINNQVDTIVVGGNTFTPQSGLDRGDITDGGREPLEVHLAASHPFVQFYQGTAPGQMATVTIQWYNRDDPYSLRVIYKGFVKSVATSDDGERATLYLASIVSTFDREVPDETFSPQCQNFLYDTNCGVDKDNFKHVNTVTAVSGNDITVTGLGAQGADWAMPGYVTFGTEDHRQILAQDGDTITLALPFDTDVTGETVSVYAGCDHIHQTCIDKFGSDTDSGRAYRGCPFVPTKNVFQTGIN